MNQNKMVFFVKSYNTKIFILFLWPLCVLWFIAEEWGSIKTDLLYVLITTVLISIPFLFFLFSGKQITIDCFSKKIVKSFKVVGWPVVSRSLNIEISEVFTLPSVDTYSNQAETTYSLQYSVYIGKFQKQHLDNKSGRKTYESLIKDLDNFTKSEIRMREIAKKLSIPARIYWWSELTLKRKESIYKKSLDFREPTTASKSEGELNTPFVIPKYIEEYESKLRQGFS